MAEILLDIENDLPPWKRCMICGKPLMFHWRGRPCLSATSETPDWKTREIRMEETV
jgi:hypothetical protein